MQAPQAPKSRFVQEVRPVGLQNGQRLLFVAGIDHDERVATLDTARIVERFLFIHIAILEEALNITNG